MIHDGLPVEPIDLIEDLWWCFYLRKPLGLETKQMLIGPFIKLGAQVVREHISNNHYQLLFHDPESGMYFEISNGDDISSYLTLGVQSDQMLPPETAAVRLRADYFLEYGKICWQSLQPLYAYAENLNIHVEMDDIEAYRLTRVCWAQFFGAQFVRGFGHDILNKAPAWRNENLSDGSLLYVLAASPYLIQGARQYWQQAREYFTQYVSTPIQWGDIPE
jgi:hypothetical protein